MSCTSREERIVHLETWLLTSSPCYYSHLWHVYMQVTVIQHLGLRRFKAHVTGMSFANNLHLAGHWQLQLALKISWHGVLRGSRWTSHRSSPTVFQVRYKRWTRFFILLQSVLLWCADSGTSAIWTCLIWLVDSFNRGFVLPVVLPFHGCCIYADWLRLGDWLVS